MSRKWERMVHKNTKVTNKLRVKQGKGSLSEAGRPKIDRFKGRNIIIPSLFAGVSVLFAIVFARVPDQGAMYYFTFISYLVLALLFFFRRPFLNVGKDYVSTRKFGVDQTVYAKDIKQITAKTGKVSIEFNNKKLSWVFNRNINLYNTNEMAEKLQQFAQQHSIPFVQQS